jgi:hypothetical protein
MVNFVLFAEFRNCFDVIGDTWRKGTCLGEDTENFVAFFFKDLFYFFDVGDDLVMLEFSLDDNWN